jgi:hypothetical protein
MKPYIIPTAFVGVMGVIALTVIPSTSSVMNVATTTVETVEVTPDWAQDEDAVEAAKQVLRRKELETELATLEEEVAERNARIIEIEKELGTF